MSSATAFQLSYEVLFRLDIYHSYFLDRGTTPFASLSPAQQQAQLDDYGLFREIEIRPAPPTQRLMQGQRMFLKKGIRGLEVLVEGKAPMAPRIGISRDLEMVFFLVARSSDWLELSNLPVEGTPLKTINTASGPVKHLAYYEFSNGAATSLPELARNGQSVSLSDRLDQVPTPAPLQVPPGCFSVLRIQTYVGANHPGNLIDPQGGLLGPRFSLSFDNRETVWRYLENGQWLNSQHPLPLSNGVIRQVTVVDGQGIPAVRELPNPRRGSHRQDPNDPQKLISLIYL